jgi:septal ring factor EnvC (AmiA/AmiB activator)
VKKEEFTVVLEDINEKLGVLVEGHKLLNEKMDRRHDEYKAEFQQIRTDVMLSNRELLDVKKDVSDVKKDIVDIKKDLVNVKKDLFDVKKDLTDHRENTELHPGKKKKKAS